PYVSKLAPQSAAYASGMQVGDIITAVDGTAIYSFNQLKERVETSNGSILTLKVWRDGTQLTIGLTPRRVDEPTADNSFVSHWRIGIIGSEVFKPATESTNVWWAAEASMARTLRIIEGSLSGMYHMVTGAISSCNLSGPIGIAQVSGAMASQGSQSFIIFIAVLSTAVGLLNLFPIPPLDGGQLVFFIYEALTGRPANNVLVRFLMLAGLAAILSLMVFGLSNDLFCP
ncbi:MAG: site-2 protease family protein, partial [Paracoccaceae bacterium]|nr:site-2 protease family protein [Paracoccaceae bacterium]